MPSGGAPARGAGWDRLAIWREWASDARGHGLLCGHFLPEEALAETRAALVPFLSA